MSQILGYPKSVGQIYGLLFFATKPQSLDDIAAELGLSKASVSNGVRKLLAWGVIRQAWVQGDRKEFLEVVEDVSILLRAGHADFVKPKVNSSKRRISDIGQHLDEERAQGSMSNEEYEIVSQRLGNLKKIQSQLERIVPLLERLL